MSYSATLTQRNIVYSRRKEHALINQNQNRRVVIFLLTLFIILFSILYIVQANNVATGGYKIQKYKKELTGLQSKSKNLELKLSEVRSLEFLKTKLESLDMVKLSKVEYLSPITQVAAK